MSDDIRVYNGGVLDEFQVWREADQGKLFLDIFVSARTETGALRYEIPEDKAKELLRQMAVLLAGDDTLELSPPEPKTLQ